MPKGRRRESHSGFYHVVVKGINKERTFNQPREKFYFEKIILKYIEEQDVEIHAYCIMSTHAHFIIRAEIKELSYFMARILADYASYYNFKHQRNGHVFQNRFTSECIETESYFWNCLRYIHMNPVKAKMAKTVEAYKHSSAGEYYSATPKIIHEKAIQVCKKRFETYRDFEEFHSKRQREVFCDIAEEIVAQQLEIGILLAEKLLKEKKLHSFSQIFEEISMREEYIRQLKQTLSLSKTKGQKVYDLVEKTVKNA